MRVLWVPPRPYVGAVEAGTVEGIRALGARGHEQHLLLPASGPLEELIPDTCPIHIAPHNQWLRGRAITTARQLAHDISFGVRRVGEVIDRVAPDVVITETALAPTAALAARSRRSAHVWRLHGFLHEGPLGPPLALGRWLTIRGLASLGDATLCVSDAVRRDAARWIPPHRLFIVPWAADLPPVEAAPRSGTTFRLVLAGLKGPLKGQHEAIQGLSLLRARGLDVELDLVGSAVGGYEEYLTRLAEALGVARHVRFLPHRGDALGLVAGADVALVCSRLDAAPRTLIEAMKLGTPVVAAADYGVVEQIEYGRTGLLYRPGDAAALADQVQRLLGDRGLSDSITAQARAWANEHYNLDRYGETLQAALRAVVGTR